MKKTVKLHSGPGSLKNSWVLLLFCVAATIPMPAQSFTNLVTFNNTNGGNPLGSLIQGVDGNLYGTTAGGGPQGFGTAFQMTTTGNLTVIYNFCSLRNCVDGFNPAAGLALGEDGNFYGTTTYGGVGGDYCNTTGCGAVFKLTPTGTLTTLYSFCIQTECADGANPLGALVQGANGAFYGTTTRGDPFTNSGTVFEITSTGEFTVRHDLAGSDGYDPQSALTQGRDGNFYGTAQQGGGPTFCPSGSCGTIFKMSPSGTFSVLYDFCSQGTPCADGSNPVGGLVQGSDGNFYGTTVLGDTNNYSGTIFKITPSGVLTTLYRFCSKTNCTDGAAPEGTLVEGTDGNFYGTTEGGGRPRCVNGSTGLTGCGTVFRITPAGKLTTLYAFCPQKYCHDGAQPQAGLFQATDGNFYGTTVYGGAHCFNITCGTVYRLSVGLGPFVSLPQPSGKVGQSVQILGQGLTGTTGVFFSGTPASFTIVSDTYIQASVPAGATTGRVQVTTSSGPLKSNVLFHVVR